MKLEMIQAVRSQAFDTRGMQNQMRMSQDVNRAAEVQRKTPASQRPKGENPEIQSRRASQAAELSRTASQQQSAKALSRQASQVVSRQNIEVNRALTALIAPPMPNGQPFTLGQFVDTMA